MESPAGFRRLRLYQYRNLHDSELDLDRATVVLVGDNGQGKTNLLEALYLLSYGNSFRTRRDADLCRTGTDTLAVVADYGSADEQHEIDIRYIEGRKKITLDGSAVTDRRDIVSVVPTVLFQHDDMAFVTGGPEMQRQFLDQTISMHRPAYIDDLRRYRRALRSRNAALKDGRFDLVELYDSQVVAAGFPIVEARSATIERFAALFTDLYGRISHLPEPVCLEYRPSWRGVTSVGDALDALGGHRSAEERLRTTMSGPHRDRLAFRFRGANFLDVASTGQVRLVALMLRTAQAEYVRAETSRLPVLLLDDVMLELDPSRRERFLAALPPSRQRIFTVLPGESLSGYGEDDSLIYSVSDGRFERTPSG